MLVVFARGLVFVAFGRFVNINWLVTVKNINVYPFCDVIYNIKRDHSKNHYIKQS